MWNSMQRTRVRFPRKVHALNIFAKNFLMIYFEKHAYTHGIFKLLLIFEVRIRISARIREALALGRCMDTSKWCYRPSKLPTVYIYWPVRNGDFLLWLRIWIWRWIWACIAFQWIWACNHLFTVEVAVLLGKYTQSWKSYIRWYHAYILT